MQLTAYHALAAQGRMATGNAHAHASNGPETQTRKRRSALPAALSDNDDEMQVDGPPDTATAAPKAKELTKAGKGKVKTVMATIDEDSETELETDVDHSEGDDEEGGENEHEDEDLQGLEGQAAVDALMQSAPKFSNKQVSQMPSSILLYSLNFVRPSSQAPRATSSQRSNAEENGLRNVNHTHDRLGSIPDDVRAKVKVHFVY